MTHDDAVTGKLSGTMCDGLFAFSDLIAYELPNETDASGKSVAADVPMISIDHIREMLPYLKRINTIWTSGRYMADVAFEKYI